MSDLLDAAKAYLEVLDNPSRSTVEHDSKLAALAAAVAEEEAK